MLQFHKFLVMMPQTQEFYRNNRRLNFKTTLAEVALMSEFIIINERTGNRYNLKTPAGKYLGVRNPLGIGLYVFGGIGGVYFNPTGKDLFIDVRWRSYWHPQ